MTFITVVNLFIVCAAVVMCVLKAVAPTALVVSDWKPSTLFFCCAIAMAALTNVTRAYPQFGSIGGVTTGAAIALLAFGIYRYRKERSKAKA
jgi:hypothetical protein